MIRSISLLGYISFFLISLISDEEPSPPKTPEQELASFHLATGIKMELVAAEPLVQDPVLSLFDEKGRLWVVEMRGFMPDIDRTGEEEPIGCVKYLEDLDGDGKMDKATIYADSLILPRAIQFYPDGLLISENIPLWFYQDTDGDGKADKRTLVDSTYGGGGLPEHSANGLLWGMDNWLYNAKSKYRYKRDGENWIKEETEFRGQWGISNDNYGRLIYNYNWSQLHGDQVPPNYLSRNPNHEATTGIDYGLTLQRRIYPVRPNPAVNRGYIPGTLDSAGRLQEFTSACSPFVYRGGAMGESFEGNTLVCEPAGNLVKRNNVVWENLSPLASDAYPDRDMLASEDERFRPVSLSSGPDGAIYLTDMYRGISQHGAYMTEYLRKITLDRKLDKHIHYGRIWRIITENYQKPGNQLAELKTTAGLVKSLENDNAWYRETAQRILVQENYKSAIPLLNQLLKNSSNPIAKIHALYTLDGLNELDGETCLSLLKEKNDFLKSAALRLLEPKLAQNQILKNKTSTFIADNLNNIKPVFALQILLSSSVYEEQKAFEIISSLIADLGENALLRDAALSALNQRESGLLSFLSVQKKWGKSSDYQEIFIEQLAVSILKSKNPENLLKLLDRLSKKSDKWQDKSILKGLSFEALSIENEPIIVKSQPLLFQNINSTQAEEQNILANLSKAFTWPGKKEIKIAETRKIVLDANGKKQFAAGRQQFLTYCAGCHGSNGKGMRRFAPPLAQSEWVTGDPEHLALILLHGLEGPIDVAGHHYDVPEILTVMPSHSTLSDNDLANVMTYIRNEWGHESEPVSRRTVGMLRLQTQGKVIPWTPADLKQRNTNLNR